METPTNWHWRRDPLVPAESAIFDLDGVLADASGRQHYLDRRVRDWDGFFEAAGQDSVLEDSVTLLHTLARTLQVVVLTARPVFIRPATVEWLERHELAWDLLVMRPDFDRTPSEGYKRDSLLELRKVGFEPVIGFEDDVRNVAMMRAEGVPCVYIHSGYYD